MDRATVRLSFISVLLAVAFIAVFSVVAVWGFGSSADTALADAHTHDGYTAWTATDSLPTEGNYYLTDNVTVSEQTIVQDGNVVNLCLNGYSVTNTVSRIYLVNNGGTLHVYDDVGSGSMRGEKLNNNYDNSIGTVVRVAAGGYFELHGGTLYGSSTPGKGYFTVLTNGEFVMSGGMITEENDQFGVQAEGANSVFRMTGGTITNCKGGGVHVYGGTAYISGGTISNNGEARAFGGVLLLSDYATSKLFLSGNPTIVNNTNNQGVDCNVNLYGTKTITIDGALTNTTPIGVTRAIGTFTSGWSTYMGEADPADYFVSDNAAYEAYLKNGEVCIGTPPHKHDGIIFEEWTSSGLPNTTGNWYLAADVSISDTWVVPTGTVNLCLCGHGIRMTGNNSVVTINAGATLKLYDCDTTTEHRYSLSNAKSNGAGFATVNDSLTSGYLTFKGGYVTGGRGRPINSWNRGGALYIEGAVEMYGGTLLGNGQYGTTHGGAFNTQGTGSFKMYGGSIQNNAAQCGGATRLQGSGSCEIYGGKIINNIVTNDGGAIHVGGEISVILQDCEISGNYAGNGPGAGIWMTTTGMVISGRTIITDNLTNSGESNVEIGNGYVIGVGELTDGATIGIKPQSGIGIFTSGWADVMGSADPADYFVSDNASYVVGKNAAGEAIVGVPYTVSFDMSGHGSAIVDLTVAGGGIATEPNAPTDDLYLFDGWYKEATFDTAWDFAVDTVSANITLHAKWENKPHEHDGFTFAPWTATDRLPDSGCYYLTADVTLNDNWEITEDVTLCLNGYGITVIQPELPSYFAHSVVLVSGDVTFNLYDCGNTVHYFDLDDDGKAININEDAAGERLSFVGGYLTGGHADEESWSSCGGVEMYVSNATFNLYGGNIIGNYGGAIYTSDSTFNMYGGNVCYNVAGSASSAGVTMGGAATIAGGSIHHNVGSNVGAIALTYWGTAPVVISGGSIVDNIADYGAIGDNTDRILLSGNPIITGNTTANGQPCDLLLYSGYLLAVDGALDESARIGVKLWTKKGVFTTGLNGGAIADNFISNGGLSTRINEDGEAEFYVPEHAHTWSYTALGNVISATCTFVGCEVGTQTLTLRAESKEYDGLPVAAIVTTSNGWTQANGLDLPEITYSGNTDVGTYTASITVGDATASVEFRIFAVPSDNQWRLTGIVTEGATPIVGAELILMQGNNIVAVETTDTEGKYHFVVDEGVYNIVVSYADTTATAIVALYADTDKAVGVTGDKTESKLTVVTEENLGIAVGGLEQEAQDIRAAYPDAQSVTVQMTIEPKTEETAADAQSIVSAVSNHVFTFLDIKVERKIDDVTSLLSTTSNVMEIVIPYAKVNKRGLAVYSYHDASVRTFVERSDRPTADAIDSADGTFYADKANGYVYLYTKTFSTYAIAYTPYYRVNTALSLGGYEGKVDVTLRGQDNNELFVLEDVDSTGVCFADVPMGTYTMTVRWVDGVVSRLTMTLSVGPAGATFAPIEPEQEAEPEVAEAGETQEDTAKLLGDNQLPSEDAVPTSRQEGEQEDAQDPKRREGEED